MSALLATRYADRIELASDGGTWDQHGILTGSKNKLLPAPNAPFVAGGVGGNDELDSLGRLAISATMGATVDQAIEWLSRVLPDRREITAPIPFEFVIAAISETKGPMLWRFRNLRPSDTRLPALVPCFSDYIALGPELSTEELRAAGWSHDTFMPAALNQMHAMRAKRIVPQMYEGSGLDVAPGHYVGCHVDHAIVTAKGVTIERIHTWLDVIGQPVQP